MTQLELKLAERNDHGYELRRRRHEYFLVLSVFHDSYQNK